MKYSASRNKNHFWLNLWAKCKFANDLVNTEPGNRFMNILLSPCLCKEVSNLKEMSLCKEVSNPKEMRSGICPWPLTQRSGREGVSCADRSGSAHRTLAIRGVLLIALITSVACRAALPRQLNLFCGNFWTPAVHRLAF